MSVTSEVDKPASSGRGRVRIEPAPKRVRALLRGRPVFDTTRARYVWEAPYYPTYYVPVDDVVAELRATGRGGALAEPR